MIWLMAVAAFGLCAFVASLLTGKLRRYALARAVIDRPNPRSAHREPKPRGGGMSIVVVSLGAITVLALRGLIELSVALALIGGGFTVALVGWLDDLSSLRPGVRVAAHFAAAIWCVYLLGGLPLLRLGSAGVQLGMAGALLAIPGIVWSINLYNFMDGIDGIAGIEAVTAGLAGGALLVASGHGGLAFASFCVAGASLGFLHWNWPPARIFMGDVGSGFLGFLFAAIALVSEKQGGVPLLVWIMILGVFVIDATITLMRRFLRREPVAQPHAGHAYQRATRFYGDHATVTRRVLWLNLFLSGVAACTIAAPNLVPVALIFTASLLLAIYVRVERLNPMWGTEL